MFFKTESVLLDSPFGIGLLGVAPVRITELLSREQFIGGEVLVGSRRC